MTQGNVEKVQFNKEQEIAAKLRDVADRIERRDDVNTVVFIVLDEQGGFSGSFTDGDLVPVLGAIEAVKQEVYHQLVGLPGPRE